ncbi:MAG TPA: hypothetical protein VJT71_19095 [Pyrinomonadaceae bacterium]|nr:hypothetical protein [Pyrinomonadaceae bacterium]
MMFTFNSKSFSRILLAAVALMLLAGLAAAQKRDPLTESEAELVRFHQELDKRIEIFIKAADRRFAILNNAAQPSLKKLIKAEPDWGDPPKGSRAQLVGDIAAILDEAITNIDDVSRRDERNPLISRSLRRLTAAANGYATNLNAMQSQSKDEDELAAISRALDNVAQIIEVGRNLPASEDKKKNKP